MHAKSFFGASRDQKNTKEIGIETIFTNVDVHIKFQKKFLLVASIF